MTSAGQPFLEALAALTRALGKLPQPSMIIGGVAVILRGVGRHTVDIDSTIAGEGLAIDSLLAALAEQAIVPRAKGAEDLARRSHVLLVKHSPTEIPLDISLAWLPFELEALDVATEEDFGGVPIRAARAEDLVIYKVIAWRARDREDAEQLLSLWGEQIDVTRVRDWVRQFAEVLEVPERIEEFETLVRRAKGI